MDSTRLSKNIPSDKTPVKCAIPEEKEWVIPATIAIEDKHYSDSNAFIIYTDEEMAVLDCYERLKQEAAEKAKCSVNEIELVPETSQFQVPSGLPSPYPVPSPSQNGLPIPASYLPVQPTYNRSVVPVYNSPTIIKKEPSQSYSCYELSQLLTQRVYIKRNGGSIYHYNGIIDEKLSDEDLYALILTNLEYEIGLMGSPGLLSGTATFLYADDKLSGTPNYQSNMVCFRNGVLDLQDWSFRPHHPNDFFTSYLSVDYFPGTPISHPAFDRFLLDITGGDAIILQLIWEAVGYLLTMDMNGKVFILFQGVRDSGKSALGRFISSLFNQKAVSSLDIFRMGDRFSTSLLTEKRLNISMDLPGERLNQKAVGNIKLLTGQDAITVEEKYKSARDFENHCKFLFASNYRLQLAAPDPAFESRILLIPFNNQIPKDQQNRNLLQFFEGEKLSIVIHALQAYCDLVRHNYIFAGTQRFLPGYQANKPVFSQSATLRTFLDECCVFMPKNVRTPTGDLHSAYQAFCIQRGLAGISDRSQFSRQLHALCGDLVEVKKGWVGPDNVQCYFGLSLKAQEIH